MKLKLTKNLIIVLILIGILIFLLAESILRPKVFSQSFAEMLFGQKRYSQAGKIFKGNSRGEDPVASANLAKSLYKQEKYSDAAKANEPALHKGRNKDKANFDSGNAAYRMGDYKQAIKHYRESVLLNPNDPDAKANFELALRRMKENPPPSPKPKNEPDKEKQEEIRNILGGLDNKESSDRKQQQSESAGKTKNWW
ncbi:MAG: tetratricopeptide repeat protein [Candidatus Cloacimonetes bacterium]|nr:tetratricopeptide repeat protein [Candidatus Cloacimonadota bacterium]